jgi:glutamate-1-semialdehyde 2,1-aminomutase
MKQVAPEGPVYQAGTLSGNPVAMAAGISTLKCLQQSKFYETLEARSGMLEAGLKEAAAKAGLPAVTNRIGSMMGLFFTEERVSDFTSAQTSDLTMFAKYFKGMLERGIYLAPSQYEALFVSRAHNEGDIQATILAAEEVFGTLQI